jgi:uroporphyrin-III C-methyltransferase / precorrin-2 dehydrogenase / sirohydrochlorin ferrochelatase
MGLGPDRRSGVSWTPGIAHNRPICTRPPAALQYFPLFFDLRLQKVLIVGGGEVALRKAALLERAGAAITLVAPRIVPELERRAAAGALTVVRREFVPEDLAGVRLAIVATAGRASNRWIASLCEARAIPVNVVDDREASRVIVPAIVDRDPVLIAISSAGASPVLARRWRERLEAFVPARIGELALWLRSLRAASRRRLRGTAERRRYFETLVDGPAAERFVAGDVRGAEQLAQRLLAADAARAPAPGHVILVGAGPGDPELLTLKALRALTDADVILHDRLVGEDVLDLARRDAVRICVGKAPGGAGASQEWINEQLVEYARAGLRVVRLKGGDPFVFGRGGEELEALARAGIAYSVVPGVTAASACAAYAGIPLTHRDHAQRVTLVTGHGGEGGPEHDWRALAAERATVVFYMGLAGLERIVAKLIEHGAPTDRPAALIAQGTLPAQRVVLGTLASIAAAARSQGIAAPALLIVGEVAALHAELAWFGGDTAARVSASA